MKRICMFCMAGTLAISCFSQTAQSSFVASISNADRLSLVKTSIDIPTWHEKTFWPVYEQYLTKTAETSSEAYRNLEEFAGIQKSAPGEEAYASASKVLASRADKLALLSEYYGEIAKEFNGFIALQFVQTEAMLDMMESARIYDGSQWRKYRFHPKALSQDQFSVAKRNTINNALALTADEMDNFWSVYADYEEERDAVLGESYDIIESVAVDGADFTPALAKRLGSNLLTVLERDLKLKEKYFEAMKELAGPSVAARFLAWEDYYSLVSKMHAWVESE